MFRGRLSEETELVLERGDLTRAAVDAIVNAANPSLEGGGGVDGAIHRAAGSAVLDACRALPELSPGVRCPTGEARITPGFRLAARFIIHTVGPVYHRETDPAALLSRAHRSALQLARAHRCRSVAFPAISCGVYGYPLDLAAPVALEACQQEAWGIAEIRFVLFSLEVYQAWETAAARVAAPRHGR